MHVRWPIWVCAEADGVLCGDHDVVGQRRTPNRAQHVDKTYGDRRRISVQVHLLKSLVLTVAHILSNRDGSALGLSDVLQHFARGRCVRCQGVGVVSAARV